MFLLASQVKTLAQLAERALLNQLRDAVDGYQTTASYCCGGSLPISTDANPPRFASDLSASSQKTAPPIALRWDVPNEESTAKTIHFPILPSTTHESNSLLGGLLTACAPATFGRNSEDVLDETYRKSGKLDRNQFSVDFHPHDYGIIDSIAQILMPETHVAVGDQEEHRGVVAELYKLNVSVRSTPDAI